MLTFVAVWLFGFLSCFLGLLLVGRLARRLHAWAERLQQETKTFREKAQVTERVGAVLQPANGRKRRF
jgi:hypothetical protein